MQARGSRAIQTKTILNDEREYHEFIEFMDKCIQICTQNYKFSMLLASIIEWTIFRDTTNILSKSAIDKGWHELKINESDVKNGRLDIRLIPEIIKILLKNGTEKLINKYTLKDLIAILNLASSIYTEINEIWYEFSALVHLITLEISKRSVELEYYDIWLEFITHPHLKLYFGKI
jgi:hypothetical protein